MRPRAKDTPEIHLACLLGALCATGFLLVGVVQWQVESDSSWIRFPALVAVLELLVVAGLATGVRQARPAGLAVFALGALAHLLTVLGQGPVWLRVVAALLSALHVFVVVLLNTKPAREHFGGR
ncbi:hypothetical protein [Saccharothrix coeruleofusca]|uniref:Uncharacterized protein n=1 Tax=Saccharothrix coeruleofusca TaxID=33919 RepID=A0A918ED97_9PSEU|nr:hypothetical protein [Saccharothrix coeruleofusca]MBP2338301.1 putative membrane protein [Saccharothrix coeruleofusca]GGP49294.1 hypothetical protein GCM10010185_21840 [Saccharothrix coeruleofusca]